MPEGYPAEREALAGTVGGRTDGPVGVASGGDR